MLATRSSAVLATRSSAVLVALFVAVAGAACVIGPKQDDPAGLSGPVFDASVPEATSPGGFDGNETAADAAAETTTTPSDDRDCGDADARCDGDDGDAASDADGDAAPEAGPEAGAEAGAEAGDGASSDAVADGGGEG